MPQWAAICYRLTGGWYSSSCHQVAPRHWIARRIRLGLSVSIFGLGYVGSVSAACFASMGHKVTGVDVSHAKVETMDSGRTPIIEARMAEMVAEAHRSGLLHATTDATAAVLNSEVSFVCVGTPSLKNGKLDLSHIEHVAKEIGAAIRQKKSSHVFVLRSTVLAG